MRHHHLQSNKQVHVACSRLDTIITPLVFCLDHVVQQASYALHRTQRLSGSCQQPSTTMLFLAMHSPEPGAVNGAEQLIGHLKGIPDVREVGSLHRGRTRAGLEQQRHGLVGFVRVSAKGEEQSAAELILSNSVSG